MKKAALNITLALTLFLGAAFSLSPSPALANGTCFSGGGTGTLVWDTTNCALSGGGGTGVIRGYDITAEPTKACLQVTNAQLATKIGTVTTVLNGMKSACGTVNSSGQTTDQFAFIWDNSVQCSANDTYAVCLGKVSVPSQAWPNVTSSGGVWDLHGIVNYILTYVAGSHGSISGTNPQTVASGADGTAVSAVADSGYHFTTWDDANTSASRTDTNVTADNTYTAAFAITPPANCGLGCGGVPTTYTAAFSTSTTQVAALGMLADIGSFLLGYLPHIMVFIFALMIIGMGVYWIKNKFGGRDWAAPANGLGDGLRDVSGMRLGRRKTIIDDKNNDFPVW